MKEPLWLSDELVIAIHDEQLRLFGGPAGLRDVGALESALGRAQNRFHYDNGSLPELAAAYCYGITRNHAFVDGNKRTALLAIATFLEINGVVFDAEEPDAVVMVRSLAAGEIDEAGLARWIADNLPYS